MEYVIGCDVGSQGTKAILISTEGRFAGEAYEGYPIDYPHPLWAEQPVQRWLDALTLSIRRLLGENKIDPADVRALSLATQVDGLVSIDTNGEALHPAIIWMDRRAGAQCDELRERLGEERIFELTGLNLDATHVAPKIRWLAVHHPELYQRAAFFLLPGSYLAFALTGELGVDHSNASSTLLLDVRTRSWSETMLAAFGSDQSRLAPIQSATATLGTLLPNMAERLGLRTNTLVMVGCGDEHAACLGAGVTHSGIVGDIAGTAEPVCVPSAEITFDATRLVETHCHADPDLWLLENPGFVSGGNLRWLRDQFAQGETYASLDVEAEAVPPGAEGLTFLPSLMGAMAPTWNEAARGTYAGFTLAHTRGHFVRALLEGSAYAVRDITTQMRSAGIELRELRVMGGGAKSRLWNQIKADVTGLPVKVPEITETTALGAAFVALTGVGAYATLVEASEHIVKIREVLEPDPKTRTSYSEAYERYRQTYFALLPLYEDAARRAG